MMRFFASGFLIVVVLVVGIFCLRSFPGSSPLIPREVLFGLPQKFSPQLSPDGFRIAYLAPHDGVMNIWLYDRGTKTERVLTQDKNRGILYYTWAPDGQSILFLQDQGGNENWHLFQMPLSGGAAKDLTPFEGVQARVLTLDKYFPDTILLELNKEDPSRHDVYRLDLKSGALTLVAKNSGYTSDWIVDSEMKVRGMVEATADGGHEISIRADENLAWQKVLSWDFEDSMTSSVIGFSKDGTELYLRDSRGSETAQLVAFDLLTQKTRVLFSDPQYDVGGVSINPDDHGLEMVSVYRERHEWIPIRDDLRDDLRAMQSVQKGELGFWSRSQDDRFWIIGFNNDVTPLNFYLYDKKTKTAEFLFSHRPALTQYSLAPVQPVTFLARDRLRLQGYLTLPKQGRKPFPLVLLVHGGPWTRDTWGLDLVSQWLADRGYACLKVNFRGSAGFGKKFINAGNKEWGRKMQDDLEDAVHEVVAQGIVDPKRVGIMGASYGGYAALAAAAFSKGVFQCAVDMFGPSDLATLIRSMPPYWLVEKMMILKRLGNPDTEAGFLKERSPLFSADRIRIPLLIAQGENDPRTLRVQSDSIVQALRTRGIDCEYLVFQDEGHGFVKPENRLKFFQRAEAFLAKHLKGRYLP